jgi:glycyl-tRNA synthetase
VTIRDRDSWKQVRNRIDDLPALLEKYFRGKADIENLDKLTEK